MTFFCPFVESFSTQSWHNLRHISSVENRSQKLMPRFCSASFFLLFKEGWEVVQQPLVQPEDALFTQPFGALLRILTVEKSRIASRPIE